MAEAVKEVEEARMKDLAEQLEKNMGSAQAAQGEELLKQIAQADSMAAGGFVGIDLGVSCAVASSTQASPQAVTVNTNDVSGLSTPATVSFQGKQRHVGVAAEGRAMQAPKQTWTHLPLTLGDEDTVKLRADKFLWPFAVEGGKLGPVTFNNEAVTCSPIGPLSVLLRTCASYAGSSSPKDLCVAVHDFLSDAEVAGVRDALLIAGFDGAHLLRHSDAVVSAFVHTAGNDKKLLPEGTTERTVAFVDVGLSHGTVSVVKFSATEGGAVAAEYLFRRCNEGLGVQTFITALVKEAASRIDAKHKCKVDLRGKAGRRLSAETIHCMKQLSMLPDGDLRLEAFMPEGPDGPDIDVALAFTRDAFEASVSEALEAFKAMVTEALAAAPDGVEGVELVGGGSRIPAVRGIVQEAVGEDKLRFGLDGASCVATGAAAWAAGRRLVPAVVVVGAMPEDALAAVKKAEASIEEVHSAEVARLEKRNALESYVYQVRDHLNGKDGSLMNPAEVGPYLDAVTLWFEDCEMAEEPTSLEAYSAKLDEVQVFVKDKGAAYFEKKVKEREDQEKALAKAAEEERARRKELGMDADKDDRHMKKEDRLRLGMKNKDEGNDMFKAQKFDDAIRRYKKAIEHVSRPEAMSNFTPAESEEARKIKVSAHLNSAQCYIKGADTAAEQAGNKSAAEPYYKKAKTSCDEVLSLEETNMKGLFRRALCSEKMGDIDAAMKDIKRGLKEKDDDADFAKAKARLEKHLQRQKDQQIKMAKKMFG